MRSEVLQSSAAVTSRCCGEDTLRVIYCLRENPEQQRLPTTSGNHSAARHSQHTATPQGRPSALLHSGVQIHAQMHPMHPVTSPSSMRDTPRSSPAHTLANTPHVWPSWTTLGATSSCELQVLQIRAVSWGVIINSTRSSQHSATQLVGGHKPSSPRPLGNACLEKPTPAHIHTLCDTTNELHSMLRRPVGCKCCCREPPRQRAGGIPTTALGAHSTAQRNPAGRHIAPLHSTRRPPQ